MKKVFISLALALCSVFAFAQNPYLPLWEYIPDGEPYVFEDPDCPGKYRVYIYGSHDIDITNYCGFNQVVWSAPVERPTEWRYDGIAFESRTDRDGNSLGASQFFQGEIGDLLFAPDVAMKVDKDGKKKYYFYPNVQGKRHAMAAVADRPDGPFKVCNWSREKADSTFGVLGFDPAVFVDDDGRVYGYWGPEVSWEAELDPDDMVSVKPGCEVIKDPIPSHKTDDVYSFFEGSSMRKIEDKYVYVFCRKAKDGDFGLGTCNYTLAYAYGDSPLGPFTYGGTIIDVRGRDVDENGKPIYTAYLDGNTHGSIMKVGKEWFVFYHRQTGLDEFSRQAMVSRIDVKVEKGKGGKVYISEGELNSEGFCIEGLNPLNKSMAAWTCYMTHPGQDQYKWPNFKFTGSYVEPSRLPAGFNMGAFSLREPFCPVINNTAGSIVGYKYFNFSNTAKAKKHSLKINVLPEGVDGTIKVMVGGPTAAKGGKEIAQFTLKADMAPEYTELLASCSGLYRLKGKQALFFVFESETKGKSLCKFSDFQFFCE